MQEAIPKVQKKKNISSIWVLKSSTQGFKHAETQAHFLLPKTGLLPSRRHFFLIDSKTLLSCLFGARFPKRELNYVDQICPET